MQKADHLDAAKDHEHIEQPKKRKADGGATGKVRPARRQRDDHGVDGFPADPGLDAEPSAGNQGAKDCRDVCAEDSERGAREDRKRDAVFGASVSVQQHGDQHQDVAEENSEERLLPVHAAGDHAAGEHVGGNVDAHRNP